MSKMSTLIVSVEDASMVANIKASIEKLRGVKKVSEGEPFDTVDCEAYREAMEDIENGRIYNASSASDLFNQILAH